MSNQFISPSVLRGDASFSTGSAAVFNSSGNNTTSDVWMYNSGDLNEYILSIGHGVAKTAANIFVTLKDEKVGIGTTDPNQKLSVKGVINSDANDDYYGAWLSGNSDGTANNYLGLGPWYSTAGYVSYVYNNRLKIYTYDATEHVTLQEAGGFVGIGTTAPRTKLEIGGSGSLGAVTNKVISATFDGGYSTTNSLQYNVNAFIGTSIGSTTDIFSSTGSETDKNFYTGLISDNSYFNGSRYSIVQGGAERLTIARGGNVGIGTASPDGPLNILRNNPDRTTALDLLYLTATNTTTGYNGNGTAIVDYRRTYSESSRHAVNRIKFIERGNSANDYGGAIQFQTKTLSSGTTAPVTRMSIDYNGNVGIGTTSPNAKLHIGPDSLVSGYTPDRSTLAISDTTNGGQLIIRGQSPRIWFDGTAGGNAELFLDGSKLNILSGTPDALGSSRLYIKADGNVGIGTDSPGRKLSVNGSIELTGSDMTLNTTSAAIRRGTSGQMFLEAPGDVTVTIDSNSNNTDRVFNVRKDTGSELFRIQENGNVGINTTSPDFKLDVEGTFGVSDLPFNTDSVSVLVANETLGGELVVDGNFNSASGWNLNSNWTISGGTCNADGTSNNDINQNQSVGVVGAKYRISYVISAYTQGTISARIGSGVTDLNTGTGTFTQEVTATTTDRIRMNVTGSFIGSVDSLSIKQITSASNQIQKREISSDVFTGGPFLPLTAGSGYPLTGDLYLDDGLGASPSIYLKNGSDNYWRLVNGSTGILSLKEGTTDILTFAAGGNATFEGTVTINGGNLNLYGTAPVMTVNSSNANSGFRLNVTGLDADSDLLYRLQAAGTVVFSVLRGGNATFTTQAFATVATSTGDASSTLTTKGYVDGLITGATIYRGTWDPDVSLNSGYGSPDLSGVTQTSGYYYICSADGTAIPNGAATEPNTWSTGDWVIWNDDIGAAGEWQKIDNSSVISGAGTGQTVALWEGAASVTDSETLGNAPITVSGNNVNFADSISVADSARFEGTTNPITIGDGFGYGGTATICRHNGPLYLQYNNGDAATDLNLGGGGTAIRINDSENNNYRFTSDSADSYVLGQGGQFGVGITSPNATLHVKNNAAGITARIQQAADGEESAIRFQTLDGTTARYSDIAQSATTGNLDIRAPYNATIPNLTIKNGGDIGISTSSPQAKLHVAKNGNANGGSILMGLQGDASSKWSYLAGTHYNQATTGSNGMAIIGGLSTATYNKVFIGGSPYEINPATKIEFWTHSATTHNLGGSQRGYVDSGGNWYLGSTLWIDAADDYVGIGTTTPSSKLEVVDQNPYGGILITGGNAPGLTIKDSSSTSESKIYVQSVASPGSSGNLRISADNNNTALNPTIEFRVGNSEKMRITDAGAIRFNSYTAGTLVTDSSGNITVSSGGGAGGPYLPLAGGTMTGNIVLNDNVQLQLGTTADLRIYNNGTDSFINNINGNLSIRNNADNKDIYFQSDNGTGTYSTYFYLDGSLTNGTTVLGATRFPDNSKIFMGTGGDLVFNHDGTDSFIDNLTGDLYITNGANDKNILFQSDNGSGGIVTYLTIDGSETRITASKDILFSGTTKAKFGAFATPLEIYHDQSNGIIDILSGNLRIEQNNGDPIAIFKPADGVELYYDGVLHFVLDNGGIDVTGGGTFTGNVLLGDGDITMDSNSSGQLQVNGTGYTGAIALDATAMYIYHNSSLRDLVIGTNETARLTIDGSSGNATFSGTVTGTTAFFTTLSGDLKGTINTITTGVTQSPLNSSNLIATTRYVDTAVGAIPLSNYFPLAGSVYDGNTGTWSNAISSNVAITSTSGTNGVIIGDEDNGSGQVTLKFNNSSSTSLLDANGGDLEISAQNYGGGSNIILKATEINTSNFLTYLQIVGNSQKVRVPDDIKLTIGTGDDLQIFHNATDSFIINEVGNLKITNGANDKDIIFESDDGTGGTATYFYLDGSLKLNRFLEDTLHNDDVVAKFGTGSDLRIQHSSGNNSSYIQNYTGDLVIDNLADDKDIIFKSDDGSGGTTPYFQLDGSHTQSIAWKDIHFVDGIKAKFGDYASPDLEIYHDGSDSYISDTGTGSLIIRSADNIKLETNTAELYFQGIKDGAVKLYYDNAEKLITTSTGVDVAGQVTALTIKSIPEYSFKGDTDTGLIQFGANADSIGFMQGGKDTLSMASTGAMRLHDYTATAVSSSGSSLDANQNFQAGSQDTLALLAVDTGGNVVRGSQEGTWTFTKAQLDALTTSTTSGTTLIAAPGTDKAIIVEESNLMIKYSGTDSMSSNSFVIRQGNNGDSGAEITRLPSGQINTIMSSAPANPSYGFYSRDLPLYNNDGRSFVTNKATFLTRINTTDTPGKLISISIKLKYRIFNAATF